MTILKQGFPNFRFSNESDAMKAIELVRSSKPMDMSLPVAPFESLNGTVFYSKDYVDAPFELCAVHFEDGENNIVNVEPKPQTRITP